MRLDILDIERRILRACRTIRALPGPPPIFSAVDLILVFALVPAPEAKVRETGARTGGKGAGIDVRSSFASMGPKQSKAAGSQPEAPTRGCSIANGPLLLWSASATSRPSP
jgi:hypothetical protein